MPCQDCSHFFQHPTPDGQTACFKCYPYEQVAGNEAWIRSQIFTKKGAGTLKASLSSNRADPISYYVWRMARFHGGADMTMPVMAAIGLHGLDRPARARLEALVDVVAKEAFGGNMRAAQRWGKALGYL